MSFPGEEDSLVSKAQPAHSLMAMAASKVAQEADQHPLDSAQLWWDQESLEASAAQY